MVLVWSVWLWLVVTDRMNAIFQILLMKCMERVLDLLAVICAQERMRLLGFGYRMCDNCFSTGFTHKKNVGSWFMII